VEVTFLKQTSSYACFTPTRSNYVYRHCRVHETRNDIIHNKFGFFSFSWGSTVAPVVCAVEKRIHAAVLHAPGFMMQKTLPEADPLNFLPQVQIPVLMLNGKNDAAFPLETTQEPVFKLLGTPEKDKKRIIYPGGHLVPRSELMKETLFWFDKYLGEVK
jgi:dienelactone hydrolase